MDFVCYDKNSKIFVANEEIDKVIIVLEGSVIKKNREVFTNDTTIIGEECLLTDKPFYNPFGDLYIGSDKAIIGEIYKS